MLPTLLCLFVLFSGHQRLPVDSQGTPIFQMKFYALGVEMLPDSLVDLIRLNVSYLNEEFEGRIKFDIFDIQNFPEHEYIPDLFDDFTKEYGRNIKKLIAPIEHQGYINIFLCNTFERKGEKAAMMGFTPVLRARHQHYTSSSPSFDRLYIAYDGLMSKTTLVHEMGHFLGLSHPWDMSSLDNELMGLNEANLDHNHMGYSSKVQEFTTQQLDRMHHFALHFRNYLIR